jgi:hypothetical protein
MTSPPASKTTATLATAWPSRCRRFCAHHHCYSSPIPTTGGLRHEVQELLVNTLAGDLLDETDTPIPRPRDGVDAQRDSTTRTANGRRRPATAF